MTIESIPMKQKDKPPWNGIYTYQDTLDTANRIIKGEEDCYYFATPCKYFKINMDLPHNAYIKKALKIQAKLNKNRIYYDD